ncbi:MAG TPA: hypothetical protein VEY13_02980 [Rubrobacteraceae bacterium]|nr:hypothetical protein [Rubrobacteraceae bacterium]
MDLVDEELHSIVGRFESTEAATLPRAALTHPSIAAAGSVARKALASPLLLRQLARRGIEPKAYRPYGDVGELFRNYDWSLALVLSPFKQAVQYWCDEVTPSAERSGVVDTILQDETGKRIGINTNVSGAAWAVRHLMGGTRPRRCLIAGTGASARSCVVSLRDSYGELEIGVIGRNPVRTSDFAAELSVSIVEKIETYGAGLVINATTVGETNDNELGFPLDTALTAGVRYFDLNNRTSTLQTQALQRGCVTLSGILMQSVVNALRAHLMARKGDRP